jgi:hypothetical protein
MLGWQKEAAAAAAFERRFASRSSAEQLHAQKLSP